MWDIDLAEGGGSVCVFGNTRGTDMEKRRDRKRVQERKRSRLYCECEIDLGEDQVRVCVLKS